MNSYLLEVKKPKRKAKCRVCSKSIYPTEVALYIVIQNDYTGTHAMFMHSNCVLGFLIKEIKEMKYKEMKAEFEKFEKLDRLLK